MTHFPKSCERMGIKVSIPYRLNVAIKVYHVMSETATASIPYRLNVAVNGGIPMEYTAYQFLIG